jgi:hypothetical protein
MGVLQRLRGKPVPWWVQGFMDAGQYEAFEAALHADLRSRGWTWRQEDDGIFVDGAPGEEPTVYGLTNIAQRCAAIDRSDWPVAIKDHFDHVSGTLAGLPDDDLGWEGARPLLKLRVFTVDQAESMSMVSYPLTPVLVAALVVDYPTTVRMLVREHIADWPPVDELYAVALENLRADPAPDWQRVGIGPEAFLAMLDDSFFTAARVLLLPDGVDLGGAPDAVVAIPNRHALLVHPIRDLGVVKATQTMIAITARLFDEGPGSISRDLYWWHGGALTTIPVQVDGKSVSMFPPDAFVERMNALGEPGTG